MKAVITAPGGTRGTSSRQGLGRASLPGKLQHALHHGPDPVVDVVQCGLAHEGWGRDHLALPVHVSFVCRVRENHPQGLNLAGSLVLRGRRLAAAESLLGTYATAACCESRRPKKEAQTPAGSSPHPGPTESQAPEPAGPGPWVSAPALQLQGPGPRWHSEDSVQQLSRQAQVHGPPCPSALPHPLARGRPTVKSVWQFPGKGPPDEPSATRKDMVTPFTQCLAPRALMASAVPA